MRFWLVFYLYEMNGLLLRLLMDGLSGRNGFAIALSKLVANDEEVPNLDGVYVLEAAPLVDGYEG